MFFDEKSLNLCFYYDKILKLSIKVINFWEQNKTMKLFNKLNFKFSGGRIKAQTKLNSNSKNNQINNDSHQAHSNGNKLARGVRLSWFNQLTAFLRTLINSFSNLKSLLTKSKYITISLLSIILIIALIPIINNIKHQQTTKAEQVGNSPNNSKTSTLNNFTMI